MLLHLLFIVIYLLLYPIPGACSSSLLLPVSSHVSSSRSGLLQLSLLSLGETLYTTDFAAVQTVPIPLFSFFVCIHVQSLFTNDFFSSAFELLLEKVNSTVLHNRIATLLITALQVSSILHSLHVHILV